MNKKSAPRHVLTAAFFVLSATLAAPAFSKDAAARDVAAPMTSAAGYQIPQNGYLPAGTLHIDSWLPPAPSFDSTTHAFDIQTFLATRALTGSERFKIAEADNVNVLDSNAMATRFSEALGGTLTDQNAPLLFAMFKRLAADSFTTLGPLKKQLDQGGRHRPFVDFPGAKTCEAPQGLAQNGSYPSGHAFFGWMWANMLAEVAPSRADALFKRGLEFGDSRVICGFHYPSDVQAGRLAAAQLMTWLHTDRTFRKEFTPACKQAARALKISADSCAR